MWEAVIRRRQHKKLPLPVRRQVRGGEAEVVRPWVVGLKWSWHRNLVVPGLGSFSQSSRREQLKHHHWGLSSFLEGSSWVERGQLYLNISCSQQLFVPAQPSQINSRTPSSTLTVMFQMTSWSRFTMYFHTVISFFIQLDCPWSVWSSLHLYKYRQKLDGSSIYPSLLAISPDNPVPWLLGNYLDYIFFNFNY